MARSADEGGDPSRRRHRAFDSKIGWMVESSWRNLTCSTEMSPGRVAAVGATGWSSRASRHGQRFGHTLEGVSNFVFGALNKADEDVLSPCQIHTRVGSFTRTESRHVDFGRGHLQRGVHAVLVQGLLELMYQHAVIQSQQMQFVILVALVCEAHRYRTSGYRVGRIEGKVRPGDRHERH